MAKKGKALANVGSDLVGRLGLNLKSYTLSGVPKAFEARLGFLYPA
jgi:hypothetical protein